MRNRLKNIMSMILDQTRDRERFVAELLSVEGFQHAIKSAASAQSRERGAQGLREGQRAGVLSAPVPGDARGGLQRDRLGLGLLRDAQRRFIDIQLVDMEGGEGGWEWTLTPRVKTPSLDWFVEECLAEHAASQREMMAQDHLERLRDRGGGGRGSSVDSSAFTDSGIERDER